MLYLTIRVKVRKPTSDIAYVMKNAGCIFDDAFEVGSGLSRSGLTVGKIGDDGPCLAMSAETRSFSGSIPILILEI